MRKSKIESILSAGELSTGELSAGELTAGELSGGELSGVELSCGELSDGELPPENCRRRIAAGELSGFLIHYITL